MIVQACIVMYKNGCKKDFFWAIFFGWKEKKFYYIVWLLKKLK